MSSIQLCAAHQATAAFDGDAIAQYMRTDFITLPEHFSVHEARELFVSQLASDEIPGQVFVVAGKKLRGSLSIKKLLQESDTAQSIRYLMDSCLFRVRPDDPRPQVVAELAERGLDLVPVVEKGELVGCLMEKEIAHLLEDDVTEDAQRQGATLPLEKPYLETSPWALWKKRSVWLLLPARLDDGHRHGDHPDCQPDAGMHYPVERGGVVGDPPDAQTRRHRPGCSFSAVYRHPYRRYRTDYLLQNCPVFPGAELIILPGGKDLPGCFIPARISAIALSNLSNSGASR